MKRTLPNNASLQVISDLLTLVLRTSGLDLTFRSQPGPVLTVVFDGPDLRYLLARNAELLLALEHVAAKALGLEPEEHDRISFDAGNFKAERQQALQRQARLAVEQVRRTARPFHFHAMNSRERRLLHLELANCGYPTQSEGEGAMRHLVLHPAALTAPSAR